MGLRGSSTVPLRARRLRAARGRAARQARRRPLGGAGGARRRPHRHRVAGARHRPGRARGGARATSSERVQFGRPHRRVPGDAVPPRRRRHRARSGAPAHAARGLAQGARARRSRARRRWPSCTRRRRRGAPATPRSSCTAATATRATFPSSATRATCASRASTKARARCSASSSRAASCRMEERMSEKNQRREDPNPRRQARARRPRPRRQGGRARAVRRRLRGGLHRPAPDAGDDRGGGGAGVGRRGRAVDHVGRAHDAVPGGDRRAEDARRRRRRSSSAAASSPTRTWSCCARAACRRSSSRARRRRDHRLGRDQHPTEARGRMRRIAMVAVVSSAMLGAPAFAAEAEDAAMGKRVQDLLHAHQAEVFGCVAAANGTVKGEMLVRVMVGEDQHPVKADVLKDQTGLPTLGPCLQSKIQKWDLTSLKAAAGDQVVFPLVFKPEALEKGKKRVLVPMSAQESQGPQRFLIDDQSIGEAPLASLSMLSLPANATSPAKARKDDEEEMVLYILDGGFKVGAGDAQGGRCAVAGRAHRSAGDYARRQEAAQAARDSRARRRHGAEGGPRRRRQELQDRGRQGDGAPVARRHRRQARRRRARGRCRRDHSVAQARRRRTRSSTSCPAARRRPWASRRTRRRRATRCAFRRTRAHTMKVTEPLKAIQIYAPGGPEQRFKKEK